MGDWILNKRDYDHPYGTSLGAIDKIEHTWDWSNKHGTLTTRQDPGKEVHWGFVHQQDVDIFPAMKVGMPVIKTQSIGVPVMWCPYVNAGWNWNGLLHEKCGRGHNWLYIQKIHLDNPHQYEPSVPFMGTVEFNCRAGRISEVFPTPEPTVSPSIGARKNEVVKKLMNSHVSEQQLTEIENVLNAAMDALLIVDATPRPTTLEPTPRPTTLKPTARPTPRPIATDALNVRKAKINEQIHPMNPAEFEKIARCMEESD